MNTWGDVEVTRKATIDPEDEEMFSIHERRLREAAWLVDALPLDLARRPGSIAIYQPLTR